MDQLRVEYALECEPSAVTLADLFARWMASLSCKESSKAVYAAAITKINAVGGDWLVQDLSPLRIDSLFQGLRSNRKKNDDRTAGPAIRSICVTVLKTALDYAITLEVIRSNPADHLKKPKQERREIRPFTYDEVKSIIDESASIREEVVIVLAVMLGLRQGEAFGLRWRDTTAKSLTVSQQATTHGTTQTIGSPKTTAGRRTLPLPQRAIDALKRRRISALDEKRMQPDDYIIPAPTGKPFTRDEFSRRVWRPLLKRLNLDYRGMHHARHSCATLLLDQGVAIQVVAAILGHSSPKITLSLYAHLIPRADTNAVSALENRLGYSATTAREGVGKAKRKAKA